MSESTDMSEKKVWFITGAGRGMGIELAKAALEAGHAVVGTGRNPQRVREALGEHEDLLAVALDITSPEAAETAVQAAVERFGRIDVLVNNAANFYAGYFEELSPEQFRAQLETNVFGPANVTRAVLPVMRAQRSGHIITIGSLAGIVGGEHTIAYNASKFAVEGFMEALKLDVAPYGIKTTIVEPGFFRTELVVEGSSLIWPERQIEDYAARTEQMKTMWRQVHGQQAGDPAKLGAALVEIVGMEEPPFRFVAGADAVAAIEGQMHTVLEQIDQHRDLSTSLAYEA